MTVSSVPERQSRCLYPTFGWGRPLSDANRVGVTSPRKDHEKIETVISYGNLIGIRQDNTLKTPWTTHALTAIRSARFPSTPWNVIDGFPDAQPVQTTLKDRVEQPC